MEGRGGGEPEREERPMSSETLTLISATDLDSRSDSAEDDRSESGPPPVNRTEILRALEVVERDSMAISESFASLFASLRVALSGVCLNGVFPFLISVWIPRK